MLESESNRLDRPVDETRDHVLGPADAEITLVEYGSYACPHCRAANDEIAAVRDRLGSRLRYVFRHRPLVGSDIARRAAELVERAENPRRFWQAHIALMTRSETLTEDDLAAVASDLGLAQEAPREAEERAGLAKARVDADEESARVSGVMITPTFFINGRRYDGPWDESSLSDAMIGRLGHRVRSAALNFGSWGPSAGVFLLIATILAIVLANSPVGPGFEAFWRQNVGITVADAGFRMSLLHWVDDGLLTIFFLVVGLEIKREFTVGRLATWRTAALPIAGAIGGMIAPAIAYSMVISPGGWSRGWGVPMPTDTAFAVALIVMMGRRVPVELRIFLTAAAIVDDIGTIAVVAVFYSSDLHLGYLAGAVAIATGLGILNRSRVYQLTPYVILGATLWAFIYASGLHATLGGVILALMIPTRPPANLRALTLQADTIIASEARQVGEVLRSRPSLAAIRALDEIYNRLESPADRLLRRAGARSSYVVLPLFALANGGVEITKNALSSHPSLMLAIMVGLVIGKPLGLVSASALAVWFGIAAKPDEYSWRQLLGAGASAGIGFTMSLFIAGQAFPAESDLTAAKIAVFAASILSATIGTSILWDAQRAAVTVQYRRIRETRSAATRVLERSVQAPTLHRHL
jgi:NhaA family Na+:H+ antiporter